MTREEALNKIGELVVYARAQGWDEEFTEAFETLSAEPCEDAISRHAVLAYIEFILTHGMGKKKSFEFIKKYVEKQPSVTQKQNDVLDKIRTEIVELWKNEPCAKECGCLDEILHIIDKYKAESED